MITPKRTETIHNNQEHIPKMETRLSIISSVQCRICYDNDKEEVLIAPCQCKGTVAFVHCSCLERWLAESKTTTCELCHQTFKTERTPKYTSGKSIWKWLTRSQGAADRGVRGDILACTIITPLAIVITYICLFSSDYYNQNKFEMMPAARWTSISLLIMIGIMLIGYYMWVYSVIRVHSRMWYNWWQRECVVRYIPNSSANLRCPRGADPPPNNTPNSPTERTEDAIQDEVSELLESTIESISTESQHEIINIEIVVTNPEGDKETPV